MIRDREKVEILNRSAMDFFLRNSSASSSSSSRLDNLDGYLLSCFATKATITVNYHDKPPGNVICELLPLGTLLQAPNRKQPLIIVYYAKMQHTK